MASMLLSSTAKHLGMNCRCCWDVKGKTDRRKATKSQRQREKINWKKENES